MFCYYLEHFIYASGLSSVKPRHNHIPSRSSHDCVIRILLIKSRYSKRSSGPIAVRICFHRTVSLNRTHFSLCPDTRPFMLAKPPAVRSLADCAPYVTPDPIPFIPFAPASVNVFVAESAAYDPSSSLPFLSARLIPSFDANCPTGFNNPLSPTWFPTKLCTSSWSWST